MVAVYQKSMWAYDGSDFKATAYYFHLMFPSNQRNGDTIS